MEKAIPAHVNGKSTWVKIIRNWQLYVMIAPAVILIFIFSYIPMAGAQIAFRDYNPVGGIWGSPWVGLKHFAWFFSIPDSWRLIRNTVMLSGLGIALGFTAPIILALMINEIRNMVISLFNQIRLPYYLPSRTLIPGKPA